MKGYKAFNKDLSCKGYQYELNKTHVFNGIPMLCNSGFHFCTESEDVLKYYLSSHMRVFEIEANGIITDAKSDCSKRACSEIKLIHELSLDEFAQHINKSHFAYKWAMNIGNKDIMINKITDSLYAYKWAMNIGNKDIMINKITDSLYAYLWACNIGDVDIMIDKIIESEYAYLWAKNIGNRDIMINIITESEYAYRWARNIGNQDVMIDKITESYYAYLWARDIGNRDIMIDKINGENKIAIWLSKWPDDRRYFIDKGLI